MSATQIASPGATRLVRTRSSRRSFLSVIMRNRRAMTGLIILVAFLLIAVLGPRIIALDIQPHYAQRIQAPSLAHPFGTDYAGRDTMSQFVHGASGVIMLSFATAVFTMIIAFFVGGAAGVAGGKIDTVLMFITDIILTVPSFPIMMVLSMVIIAGMVGAAGLGLEVVDGMQNNRMGQSVEAGLAIVILAIMFDRLTQALARTTEEKAHLNV